MPSFFTCDSISIAASSVGAQITGLLYRGADGPSASSAIAAFIVTSATMTSKKASIIDLKFNITSFLASPSS